jgi:hypothetical protein
MQNALFERFRGQPINITGDGQCDSPGFTARYCFEDEKNRKKRKMLGLGRKR